MGKKKPKKKERKEHLSFRDIEELMQNGHVYKRHKGAYRQIR
ncbi:hypothetical protein [Caloramator proteoclasticus]|nr:hypothetical protein [Caloramator proteoclasticus]